MSRFMSIKEVAEYLNLSQITIRRLIKKGEMPASKVGGQWRLEQDAVNIYLKRQAYFIADVAIPQLYFRPEVLDIYRKDLTKYYLQEAGYHGRLGLKEHQDLAHSYKSNQWIIPPEERLDIDRMPLFSELHYWKVKLTSGDFAVVVNPQAFYNLPNEERIKWFPYRIMNPPI
jgi:excisionase family DNA binding protein